MRDGVIYFLYIKKLERAERELNIKPNITSFSKFIKLIKIKKNMFGLFFDLFKG